MLEETHVRNRADAERLELARIWIPGLKGRPVAGPRGSFASALSLASSIDGGAGTDEVSIAGGGPTCGPVSPGTIGRYMMDSSVTLAAFPSTTRNPTTAIAAMGT